MNIYVSNLGFSLMNEDLKSLFSSYGEVASANIINDKFTGQSRGFGFVEMPDTDQAKAAIAGLDQSTFDGRTIKVNEAKPRESKPFAGGSYKVGGNRGGW
ncbi:RNA-binding protein [Flavihumibacter rivuli]|uniref:RNA recognition motif domain-containing protein n=1 Tax=Flavihumibacter rivuli TaxID=2838156 RepID=UPI001BDE6BF0|nr:RNA-binding protein [Flavihumibacter rivuli]ULQ56289.1 RNA-binding protein [Flavihumibacter rivuli]